MCKRLFESIRYAGLIAVMLVFSGGSMANGLGLTNEQCDIDDDGKVSVLDLYRIIGLLGTQSGTPPYRAAFDFNPDGAIDIGDYFELIGSGCFGAAGIDTSPTTVSGRVFDGLGNPLENVTVEVGEWAVGMTDELGGYSLDIPPGDTGETVITFDGSTVADPTPDFLSGQYPTIPNKPIFVNGGTGNFMRDMSLPERDLAGAVTLDDTNSMPGPDANSRILTQEQEYNNGGVKMVLPAGCQATFPAGEDPVLSITRVDPSMLPVPMPPGLASSIFVTYQPGGTVLDCLNGGAPPLVTKFNNDDGFSNAEVPINPDNPDQPFLAGVVGGVFEKLATITVVESDGTPSPAGQIGPLLVADLPSSFEFAWYHVDVPLNPCPRTTVIGQVKESGTNTPVPGASVSLPGGVVVLTDANGNFSIPNVPAGPNGPFCFSNPFSLRASATNSAVGISAFTPAVPGGSTNVGMIFVGDPGTVQGNVRKLFSLDDPLTAGLLEPFTVVPLELASVNIPGFGSQDTDSLGNYMISGLPTGSYTVQASFFEKGFFDSVNGQIDFQGDIDVHNFNFVSTGAVKVTVMDLSGNAIPGVLVDVATPGGPLPGGFQQPVVNLFPQPTGLNGMVTLGDDSFENGVPLGPCTVALRDPFNPFGPPLAVVGCFVNEHGEIAEATIVIDIPPPPTVDKELFSIARNDDQLRLIDLNTGITLSAVTITLAGDTVNGGNGLAFHPITNQLFALLKVDSLSNRERLLVTIATITGVATSIGSPGSGFAGLTFDASGTLFGVTGDGSLVDPESLFTIDQTDGSATLVGALGNGDDGEAIAFNLNDGLIYHASGLDEPIFETVDPVSLNVTDIPIDIPPLGVEATALVYCPQLDIFFWADDFSDNKLFAVTPDGSAQLIGPLDHTSKGLATPVLQD